MVKIVKSYQTFSQELSIHCNTNPKFDIKGYTIEYENTELENVVRMKIDFVQIVASYKSVNDACTNPTSAIIGFGVSQPVGEDAIKEVGEMGNFNFLSNSMRVLIESISKKVSNTLYASKDAVTESRLKLLVFTLVKEMRSKCFKVYGIDFDDNGYVEGSLSIDNVYGYFNNIIHTHLFKNFNIDDEINELETVIRNCRKADREVHDEGNPIPKEEENKDINKVNEVMRNKRKRRSNVIDKDKFDDYKKGVMGL